MNSLYKLPLHGIACEPFCDREKFDVIQSINISFKTLDNNTFNKQSDEQPHWVIEDEGKRYKTKISLAIQDQNSNNSNVVNNPKYLLKIDCQGKGLFKIDKNNIEICWNEKGTDSAHYFQTLGLALWLELNNILCIHANALAYKNKAIAFVAPSRTGKTTLTAELCKSEFSVMTDDMMALHKQNNEYVVYPSWPVARMWPETLTIIGNEYNKNELNKVHEKFDKKVVVINKKNGFDFCDIPKKLKTIYILNRVEENIDQCNTHSNICNITRLSSAEAVILLIQNSILGSAYKALSIEQSRFLKLAELIENVKVKKITYLSGKQHLSKIKQMLINDLHG